MNFFFRNYESSPTSSNCIINSLLAQNLLSCLEWHSATNNDKWDRILKSSGGLAQCSPSFASSLPWSSSEPPPSFSWSSPSWQGPRQSPCKARARRQVGWTSVRKRSRLPARWSCAVRSWTSNCWLSTLCALRSLTSFCHWKSPTCASLWRSTG